MDGLRPARLRHSGGPARSERRIVRAGTVAPCPYRTHSVWAGTTELRRRIGARVLRTKRSVRAAYSGQKMAPEQENRWPPDDRSLILTILTVCTPPLLSVGPG